MLLNVARLIARFLPPIRPGGGLFARTPDAGDGRINGQRIECQMALLHMHAKYAGDCASVTRY